VIEGLKELAQDKRIELTGSAKYHPILPLIPDNEVKRQIYLNFETNSKFFGDAYNPTGFFPPEMCYSRHVAEIAKEMGFKWIIVDEIGYSGELGKARSDRVYRISDLDFFVFFKERRFSAGLTYDKYPTSEEFLRDIDIKGRYYLLTGTDGEIYGHHKPGQEKLLEEIWKTNAVKTATISELFDIYPLQEIVEPINSSWSTWEQEIKDNQNKYKQMREDLATEQTNMLSAATTFAKESSKTLEDSTVTFSKSLSGLFSEFDKNNTNMMAEGLRKPS
jgi:alpha-amylase/alpha-mannosidase (GH57 family)